MSTFDSISVATLQACVEEVNMLALARIALRRGARGQRVDSRLRYIYRFDLYE